MATVNVGNHTRASVDQRIAHLAGQQHGLVTRAQALRCGASERAIQRRVEAGRLIAVFSGVTVRATESPLEADTLRLLKSRGLPTPMLQYVVMDGGRFVGRVDLAYPQQRVAIEVDGFLYHDDRETFDKERARGNDLLALGWRVLRITAKHLEEDPEGVVAWVRRAL